MAVRASIVLAGCILVGLLVRTRASAALRHDIWALGIYAVLVMPALSVVLPGWRVLPAALDLRSPAEVTGDSVGFAGFAAAPVDPGRATLSSGDHLVPEIGLVEGDGWSGVEIVPAPGGPVAVIAPGEPATGGAVGLAIPWWSGAWLVGSLGLLGRIAASRIALARLDARSTVMGSGPLREALDGAIEELGMTSKVRLLTGSARSMPMSWGILSGVFRLTGSRFQPLANPPRRS